MNNNSNLVQVHAEYARQAASFSASRAGYDFDAGQIRIRRARAAFVRSRVASDDTLLDIGCSEGLILRELSMSIQNGLGIDIAPLPVELARERTPVERFPNLEFRVGAVEELPVENPFSVVTAFEVIEHVPDVDLFLDAIRQRTRSGGMLVLTTPNFKRLINRILLYAQKKPGYCDPTHVKEFSRVELAALVQKHGFRVIQHSAFCLLDTSVLYYLTMRQFSHQRYKDWQESGANIRAGAFAPSISLFQVLHAEAM